MLDVIVGRALDDGMLAALQSRKPQLPGDAQNERVSAGPVAKVNGVSRRASDIDGHLLVLRSLSCSSPERVLLRSRCVSRM